VHANNSNADVHPGQNSASLDEPHVEQPHVQDNSDISFGTADSNGDSAASNHATAGSPAEDIPESSPVPEPQEPRTRLQKGIRRPKKYTDGTVRYGMFTSTGEPSGLAEALGDEQWRKAMDAEYDALMQNKTWHLVPPSPHKNLIDCKWVYRIKKHQMVRLKGIKLDLLLRVSNNDMALIMKTHLVMLLKQLL
jgi:hypothetical protein